MSKITYVTGEATEPAGQGARIIAHVCSDLEQWDSDFSRHLSARWSGPEGAYRHWARSPIPLRLGLIQVVEVAPKLFVANMVAQSGKHTDASLTPLNYANLRVCLDKLSIVATDMKASVHMPRLGDDLTGGDWTRISSIITDTLIDANISVTIYTPADLLVTSR